MKFIISFFLMINVTFAIDITWLGQASFKVVTNEGKQILIDPFIFSNPKTPEKFKNIDLYKNIDLILLTRGDGDHLGDLRKIMKLSPSAKVSMKFSMAKIMIDNKLIKKSEYLSLSSSAETFPFKSKFKLKMVRSKKGLANEQAGSRYLGEPVGYILTFSNGKTLYHAGDIRAFGDKKQSISFHHPDLALLPIGSTYTTGPLEAAYAVNELIKPKMVILVPMHYGGFPMLKEDPNLFRKFLKNKKSLKVVKPGELVGF